MHSSSFVVGYEKNRLLVCVCLQCSDQLVYGLTEGGAVAEWVRALALNDDRTFFPAGFDSHCGRL